MFGADIVSDCRYQSTWSGRTHMNIRHADDRLTLERTTINYIIDLLVYALFDSICKNLGSRIFSS